LKNLRESAILGHVAQKMQIYKNLPEQVPLKSLMNIDLSTPYNKVSEVFTSYRAFAKTHGAQHTKNVLLFANYLGAKKGIHPVDMEIINEAAVYHDLLHVKAGNVKHAEAGANWYLENGRDDISKSEVAFLIEAHEIGHKRYKALLDERFPDITETHKNLLIKCLEVLQDADKLDIFRYEIENPSWQRFDPTRLNDPQSAELMSASLELNVRQSLDSGYLQVKDGQIIKAKIISKQKRL